MQLTEHFKLAEFTRSATAEANGIKNDLDREDDRNVIENLKNLCVQVLEPLRRFADAPVIISSGYRCKELNRAVGGAAGSQHLTGEAADIVPAGQRDRSRDPAGQAGRGTCPSDPIKEWFLFIQSNCSFDDLILESQGAKRWIHVSCRRDAARNRQRSRTMKR